MTCPCRRRRGSGSIIFIVIIEIFDSIRTCGARSSFDSSFIDHSDFVQAREKESFRRGILYLTKLGIRIHFRRCIRRAFYFKIIRASFRIFKILKSLPRIFSKTVCLAYGYRSSVR